MVMINNEDIMGQNATCRYWRSSTELWNDTPRPSPTFLVFTQRNEVNVVQLHTHTVQQGSHLIVHE